MWGLGNHMTEGGLPVYPSSSFRNLPCGCLNNNTTQLNADMPTIGFLNIRSDSGLPKLGSQPCFGALTPDVFKKCFGTAHCVACLGNLKVACLEELFHVDVCIYNLSKVPCSMGLSSLAHCSLHQFGSRLPRYISFTQGAVSSALRVEIVFFFCYVTWI